MSMSRRQPPPLGRATRLPRPTMPTWRTRASARMAPGSMRRAAWWSQPSTRWGKLWTLQTIGPDGTKLFRQGGRKRGCFYLLGKLDGTIIIAEGFATAASIHEATALPVAVAFDAGNLQPVAEALRASFPDADLLIAADDDHATEGNPGASKAAHAAKAVGGRTVLPRFADASCRGTDFNDLAQAEGPAAVKAQIEAALGTLVPVGPSETVPAWRRPSCGPRCLSSADGPRTCRGRRRQRARARAAAAGQGCGGGGPRGGRREPGSAVRGHAQRAGAPYADRARRDEHAAVQLHGRDRGRDGARRRRRAEPPLRDRRHAR